MDHGAGHPDPQHGQRGVRDPGHRPAVRRQRGQAGRRRPRRGGRRRPGGHAGPQVRGRRRHHRRGHAPSRRASSSSRPASAAPASSTCSSATRSRAFAEPPPTDGVADGASRVTGTVQGVGFRPFVYRLAVELGLAGSVANDSRGVIIDVEGAGAGPRRPGRAAGGRGAAAGPDRVGRSSGRSRRRGAAGFTIVDSRDAGAPAVAGARRRGHLRRLPARAGRPGRPALRLPVHQLHQLRAPLHDHHGRSPTTGPSTTMAGFAMCADCRRSTPTRPTAASTPSRRAAPRAGPQLSLLVAGGRRAGQGRRRAGQPRRAAAAGRILAVKGLGGYHLAVDATDEAAVAELRRRKARDDKPFAVMVATSRGPAAVPPRPEAEAALASPAPADRPRPAVGPTAGSPPGSRPACRTGADAPSSPAPPPAARPRRPARW